MATAMPPPRRWLAPARGCAELAGLLRRSAEAALQHDALTLAQATAYSAIVALFPALIVAAAAMSLLPDTLPFRFQLALFFDRVLPSNVSPLLEAYFSGAHHTPHSARALLGAALVSLSHADGGLSPGIPAAAAARQLLAEAVARPGAGTVVAAAHDRGQRAGGIRPYADAVAGP